MRMLCIRGRQHPFHTGLVSGQVYDVVVGPHPCCGKGKEAHAEGSVFRRRVTLVCAFCKTRKVGYRSYVPWGPDRFVPWQEPKVDEREVRELYSPYLGRKERLPA